MMNINNLNITKENTFFLIAGPCVIESREETFEIANTLKTVTEKLNIPLIFKGSFKKANRTRLNSFTGIGDESAINILKEVKNELRLPITTDVHCIDDIKKVENIVDILQIPAFLCRQTDLLIYAAKTGKYINIKKGQFLSAENMKYAIEKITSNSNNNILATERGNMFGYNDLVVDFRSIPIMKEFDVPVVLDITHSLQQPNMSSGITGGKPKFIETIAKAGIAVGADGIFLETHPDPQSAKSDGENMLKLDLVEDLLLKLKKIKKSI
ncbi:3-deoxy-8-phosphooctulonate synthase [bacterium]|nr:3-deoxy-8-phosphooctulonate synthase [bacterium]